MTAPPLAGRRILIVEDEAMIAMALEDFIEELGCVVVGPVGSVEQAKALLETEAIDAAVLDVNLRGTRSYPVADALAERKLPFLFVTGYGQAGLDIAYRDLPVVQKPFTCEFLERALVGMILERGDS